MNIRFESERFIMRDIEESDLEGMFLLETDPEVYKYLGMPPLKTKEDTLKIIGYIRKQYEENGIGRSAVIDKATNEFVGWSGLKLEDEVRDFKYYDLGYRFRREFWGKGIASETAIASVKYGLETLKLKEICGAAELENIASNKILQKAGLQFVEEFEFEGKMHNWYKLKVDFD